jgi:hypothetical protein
MRSLGNVVRKNASCRRCSQIPVKNLHSTLHQPTIAIHEATLQLPKTPLPPYLPHTPTHLRPTYPQQHERPAAADETKRAQTLCVVISKRWFIQHFKIITAQRFENIVQEDSN